MVFKYIAEFCRQAKDFIIEVFDDMNYYKKRGKLCKEILPSIKFNLRMAKQHFTIEVKRVKTNTFLLSMTKVFDCDYKYEIAIAHKRYNHGGWVILYRGNDKHMAMNEFDRQYNRVSKFTNRSRLRDVVSKNTYTWSYKSPFYYFGVK